MLSDMYGPARLFYINGEGQLMSTDPHAFRFEGAAKIIKAFDDSVKCRNYQRTGGKPRSTQTRRLKSTTNTIPDRSMVTRASDESGRVLSANGNLSPIAPKPYGKPPLSHMTKPQLRPPVVVLLMAR